VDDFVAFGPQDPISCRSALGCGDGGSRSDQSTLPRRFRSFVL